MSEQDQNQNQVSIAFGKAIKIRRIELGISQESLANNAGIARSFLSSIERGSKNASLQSIWKISMAMKCKPSDLFKVAERIYDEK
ncbi:MAG: helix-turn-helix transcriptional regulator [Thalassolituus oleivorans]|uniref:helix-turn-helix domain-containing protein n=1 Tax=Thalassolituus oleivorans TaxID=187493 RepID=UPI001B599B36|nr:helix-turn-helix transcriptional regulator [Thalassolituus oleivorans]MBQ0726675.1 helix-turn-helix transcriptional regulator [Thalassolituus oleivorans]MBQ0780233.1 helix-turn-helix transcriptional regulator [Thalassolituus oleivorans]